MNRKTINPVLRILLGIAAPVLIIAVWLLAGAGGLINQAILPTLDRIVNVAISLIKSGDLWGDIAVSIGRVLRGFLIGAVLGVVIGVLMGLSKIFYSILQTLVGIFRPIPMIAWIPLFILWIGIGEEFKVSLIALGSFWSVLINTIHGIHTVDPKLLEVAEALEKDKKTVVFQIVLPAALPSILTGIRLGMGAAWSCVVAAEMIAASSGVGYMIMFAREMAQPAKLMVGVLVIGIIGLLIDTIILNIQKLLVKW